MRSRSDPVFVKRIRKVEEGGSEKSHFSIVISADETERCWDRAGRSQ